MDWHCTFESQIPRLFSILSNPNATVFSCGRWDGFSWPCHLSWCRVLRPRDLEEWKLLHSLLESSHLSTLDDDSFSWTPSKFGSFTVNSLSFEFAKSSPLVRNQIITWKKLWKGLIPPRIEVFTWMALLGKNKFQSAARLEEHYSHWRGYLYPI